MSYGTRNMSYKRVNSFREDGSSFMVMVYHQSELVTHYDIYPASLKFSVHGKDGEYSTYYPTYCYDRCGCLPEDTFIRLVRDGVLVNKTPDKTRECYSFYTFPEREIKLY